MSSGKAFTRKSKRSIKQGNKNSYTRRNKKYYDKLLLEQQLSHNAMKELSEKTPVVSMGHGFKLLKKGKKNLRKGNMRNAFASLITAVAVLSATGPLNQHPNVKEKRLAGEYKGRWTGDPHELAKWHVGTNPKKKLKTRVEKSKKKSRKKTKKGGYKKRQRKTKKNKKR
jgi:hypothetical protein